MNIREFKAIAFVMKVFWTIVSETFISIQDAKDMVKVTSDALFDYWQVAVSVRFARLQYLFELEDKEGHTPTPVYDKWLLIPYFSSPRFHFLNSS